MEIPKNLSMDEKWQNTLQKIKNYLKSLIDNRFKKNLKKIEQGTSSSLEKTLDGGMSDLGDTSDTQVEPNDSWLPSTEEELQVESDDLGLHSTEEESQEEVLDENTKKADFEIPPEDQDEYIPQDSEIGEFLGEQSRFAEVYPPFLGYYTQGKKSYFNRETNLWSKKAERKPFSYVLPEGIKRYTYTGVVTQGRNAVPLPEGAWPDTTTLRASGKTAPEFQVDQNGCVYLISNEKQFVSFNFGLNQHPNKTVPVAEDNEHIIFDTLSADTQELLNKLSTSGGSVQQIAAAIKYYIIKNKKYSTKVQGTLRNKSNRNNYIKHLDESPILECFSANSLFVALCRQLGIPARLVVGHMVQSSNGEGKACLTKNDGHAWSEVWDDSIGEWIRIDATPTEKEDGENSNENGQEQNENRNNNRDADNNFSDDQNQQSSEGNNDGEENTQSNPNTNTDSEDSQSDPQESSSQHQSQSQSPNNSKGELRKGTSDCPQKSPGELLDEMIKKAKEDSLLRQSEQLKDTLNKLENAETKEDIKDILDKSGLSDFAKDMVDKIGNDKILDEEKKEIEGLDDEKKIDEALQNSLLDVEYKNKLREYANLIKEKIEEEKRKMKSEMERLGFTEQELGYYKEYKALEAEVQLEVKKQIRDLQTILPAQYQILKDEEQTYRSGPSLNQNKLVQYRVTGDPLIFSRNREVRESNEINMFETIIIDTSGSMGDFSTPGSILRESIKAAITRAKVLEHFKVDFSIVLFGDSVNEVMSFGEKFSSKRNCSIPAKLIRAAHVSGGNSCEPISYVYQNMRNQLGKRQGKSFGNISFIGDGDVYNGSKRPDLKELVDELRARGFGVTAYYINNRRSDLLEYYFGTPENGGAIYAGNSTDLAKQIIEAHRKHLKIKIKKYIK